MSTVSNNSLINGTGADDPPPSSPENPMQHARMVWRSVAPDSILKNIETVEGKRYEFRVFDLPDGTPMPDGWSQTPWNDAKPAAAGEPGVPKKRKCKKSDADHVAETGADGLSH